ncbi:hypothetical protein P7K49_025513 [Saguinus oedipus]|uniref:Uncharacterized protein n=1 Tax=Saguinus oedipus TaxID=9490 RepID=A0ABQ9UHE9_SAGOE|nr:hypothetical protein P7K49_025513 [Saguinus oedipus]
MEEWSLRKNKILVQRINDELSLQEPVPSHGTGLNEKIPEVIRKQQVVHGKGSFVLIEVTEG